MSNMLDTYLSSVSNRTNETMKVLTDNLDDIYSAELSRGGLRDELQIHPELGWEYGYFIFWVISAVIVVGMMFFFRKKKWF
jgi:magnesium transporter